MKHTLFKEITENTECLLVVASSAYKNNSPWFPQHSAATVVAKKEFLSAAWEF